MEAYAKKLAFAAIVVALALVSAKPMVANGETLCNITDDGLKSCKPSVSGSNPAAPSDLCCSALAKADFQCLCFYKNNYPWLLTTYKINPDLAMQLPAKCNLVGQSFHC